MGILVVNLELARKWLLSHTKNLDTSHWYLDYRGYSCQRLLSTWHGTNHLMRWIEWWCTLLIAKSGNTLTVSILSFQWNKKTCVLGYIQIDSIHSGHLLLLILVGQWYSRFITYHQGCVWGQSLFIFIYCHTRPNSLGWNIDVLSSTINWWVKAVEVIWGFDLWCIKKINFSNERSFDVDNQWFSYLYNGFWLEHAWKTSISILYGK